MKSKQYIILALLIFAIHSKSNAQCCAAGNPVSSNSSITEFGENVLGVSISHVYSNSDMYYNGTEKLDTKYIETDFNFSYLALSFGLSNKLRILADIGYFLNKTQKFVNPESSRYGYEKIATGFGDLNLGASYDTYQSDNKEFNFVQFFKVTIPVGEFNQVYNGVELPIDLQPSSGNYKINMGIMLSNRFGNSGFSVYSINSFELSQFIETSNTMYKYGNLYNLSLLGAYQMTDELAGRLQIRFEIRDKVLNSTKDKVTQLYSSYSFINASGGLIAFLSPQLNYTLAREWIISAQFNYPIYKNVNSEQLTNKFSIQAGISKSFNFSGDEESMETPKEKPIIHDPNLLTSKIKISGNCEMCKARIEKVTNDFKNVEESDWDSETKMLTIFYKDNSPDISGIEKSIAAVGHDNDKFQAEDSVYNKLPKCCHYRK
ncbi:MAG: ATPase [Ignavibacteria bacterium]|nr:ATPase [Ignavibacteria bacterium]